MLPKVVVRGLLAICLLIGPISQCPGGETAVAGPPPRYALSDVTVSLDEPSCAFIRCPSYVVSIHGDGRVVYEGRQHVANLGQREATVEPERVLDLLNQIYRVGFFSMSGDYTYSQGVMMLRGEVVEIRNVTTDASTTAISVSIKDYQKRIIWSASEPEALLTIRSRIKEISGVDRWIK